MVGAGSIQNATMADYLRATSLKVCRIAALGTIRSIGCARVAPLLQRSIGMFFGGRPDCQIGVARLLPDGCRAARAMSVLFNIVAPVFIPKNVLKETDINTHKDMCMHILIP
jgi:hypothetical protein